VKFVGAIIENPKYGFLLQQRDEKASSYPLCWTLFGGKVEEGEKPKAALFRELKEEIKLQKSSAKYPECRCSSIYLLRTNKSSN